MQDDLVFLSQPSDKTDLLSRARIARLDEGLYALNIGPASSRAHSAAGLPLPATAVAAGPISDHAVSEIVFTSGETPGWFTAEGGTAIARVTGRAGVIVITTYGLIDGAALPELRILRLDGQAGGEGKPEVDRAPPPLARNIDIEMIVHIERQGDRRQMATGWVGEPGQRRRLEAFGVRPMDELSPHEIEYMAYGLGGRATPWTSKGELCGTRGRGMPLTGFAIRTVPTVRERFDVEYQASFFRSGVTREFRNGEPCMPAIHDDPLEAIRIRVTKKY